MPCVDATEPGSSSSLALGHAVVGTFGRLGVAEPSVDAPLPCPFHGLAPPQPRCNCGEGGRCAVQLREGGRRAMPTERYLWRHVSLISLMRCVLVVCPPQPQSTQQCSGRGGSRYRPYHTPSVRCSASFLQLAGLMCRAREVFAVWRSDEIAALSQSSFHLGKRGLGPGWPSISQSCFLWLIVCSCPPAFWDPPPPPHLTLGGVGGGLRGWWELRVMQMLWGLHAGGVWRVDAQNMSASVRHLIFR